MESTAWAPVIASAAKQSMPAGSMNRPGLRPRDDGEQGRPVSQRNVTTGSEAMPLRVIQLNTESTVTVSMRSLKRFSGG